MSTKLAKRPLEALPLTPTPEAGREGQQNAPVPRHGHRIAHLFLFTSWRRRPPSTPASEKYVETCVGSGLRRNDVEFMAPLGFLERLRCSRSNSCLCTGELAAAACNTAFALALIASVAGCRPFDGPSLPVAGVAVADATQRHPILVTQAPAGLSLSTPRGGHGLTPSQRAQVIDFVGNYRARGDGASGLVVQAPSGSANEGAAVQAVEEVREIARIEGVPPARFPSARSTRITAPSRRSGFPTRRSWRRRQIAVPGRRTSPTTARTSLTPTWGAPRSGTWQSRWRTRPICSDRAR